MLREMPRQHLYLSTLMWDGLWIIQQPICNEIQREEPVLFVERFVSVFTVLRYPRLWRRLFTWMRGARRVSANLRVLAPLPLFHLGHRFPRVFSVEFAIQRWWILLWARRKPGYRRVLWLDHPQLHCAIGQMAESFAVYHVGDEPSEFRTSHRATVTRLEQETLRKASVVFAAADELARARQTQNPRTYAISNAIDTAAFTTDIPEMELADVDAIPSPRVGFIGVLDTWVDLELLEATANALPGIGFVIVGPSRVNDRRLRSLSNCYFLGPRSRRLVPGILRRLSASLVPFASTALTARIVPAKVFEALAAGIVPVCTPFSPNLDVFERRRLALVGRTRAEYISLVGEAVASDTPERRAELSDFGLRQTWSERWKQMSQILRSLEASDLPRVVNVKAPVRNGLG